MVAGCAAVSMSGPGQSGTQRVKSGKRPSSKKAEGTVQDASSRSGAVVPRPNLADCIVAPSERQNRRSALQLNRAICNAAKGSAEEILHLVHSKESLMNLVNISTALHRLARLETDSLSEASAVPRCTSDPRFQLLLASAKSEITHKHEEVTARCLSSIGWACARLQVHDPNMMQTIGDLSVSKLEDFKPFELVILIWSFVRMQLEHAELFSKASDHILAHLDDHSAACLATAIWSFAKQQSCTCSHFCRKAVDAFVDRITTCSFHGNVNPVMLENVIWAVATMNMRPKPKVLHVITEAVLMLLENFKPHEFTITLWAFARLGACNDQLFLAASELIRKSAVLRSKLHPQGIANLFWAFAKYAEKGNFAILDSVATVLMPTVQELLPDLKPQEIGCVLSALSKLDRQWGMDPQVDQVFASVAWNSCMGEGNSFFSDLSLASVVNIMTAYARLMGCQHGSVEPYHTFVSKLLCTLPGFESQLDRAILLTILDATPLDQHWLPQVDHALKMVASMVIQHINTYSQQELACLARATRVLVFVDDTGYLLASLVAQRLLQHSLDVLDTVEISRVVLMCGLEAQETSMESLEASLHCIAYRDCGFGQGTASFGADADEGDSLVASSCTPASPSEYCTSEPAMLSIIEELSSTEEISNGTAYVTFELNSSKPYETYDIKIVSLCDGRNHDTFTYKAEAGYTIPNTQTLYFEGLEDGQHEVHFSIEDQLGEAQGEKVVHRFRCTSRQSSSTTDTEPMKLDADTLCSFTASDLSLLGWKTRTQSTRSGSRGSRSGTRSGGSEFGDWEPVCDLSQGEEEREAIKEDCM